MERNKTSTKERLLEEAYREFLAKGYKCADVNAITRRAGLTKGALYYYFKSKSELALSVIDNKISARVDSVFLDLARLDDGESTRRLMSGLADSVPGSEITRGSALIRLALEVPKGQRRIHSRIENIIDGLCDRLSLAISRDIGPGRPRAGYAPKNVS